MKIGIRGWRKERTESIKAGEATGQLLGAGDLGVDGCNGGGGATNERCTSINGSEIGGRQGNAISVNSNP